MNHEDYQYRRHEGEGETCVLTDDNSNKYSDITRAKNFWQNWNYIVYPFNFCALTFLEGYLNPKGN